MFAFLISFTSIYLVDKFICSHLPKARWFSLHAICNAINTICAFNVVTYALYQPVHLTIDNEIYSNKLISINSIWPTVYTIALHIYHIIFFKLRYQDFIHHICFVPFLLCNLSYQVKNLTIFFACGLPGMITYILLSLKRYNIISKKTEKQISFYQNLWLRAPGLLFSAFSVFYSHLYSQKILPMNLYFTGGICLIASINGMFYLQQISRTY